MTAEPFEVGDTPPDREGDDGFWSVMRRVHMELQEIDPELREDDDPQVVSLNHPVLRRGTEWQHEQNSETWERTTAEFLRDYDRMVQLMARARATVQVIRERNGWV